jgi:anti-anti-sigma factor
MSPDQGEDAMFMDESRTMTQPMIVPTTVASTSSMQTLGDVSVVQCGRTLGALEQELLRSAIQSAVTQTIVLDLARLGGIDSTGLGVLVTMARYATACSTRLKLMNVRPAVASFLNENNLLTVFEMCSPREVIAIWCRAVRHRSGPQAGTWQEAQ